MDNKELITNKFSEQEKDIKIQINNLENRINQIRSFCLDLEASNKHFKQMIHVESDVNKKSRYYNFISKNIEVLNDFMKTEASFENIKATYYKEVTDVLTNRFRMIAIDIAKIENKVDDFTNMGFFENLNKLLLTNKEQIGNKADVIQNNSNNDYDL